MATSHIPATPGAGVNAATHAFTEDSITKHAQRIVVNTPAGVDMTFGAGAAAAGTQRIVHAVDDLAVLQLGGVTETPPATDTASAAINGRLQRLAQRLSTLIAAVPATLGAKAAASSLAVTASTEDVSRIGAVTETAPGTDTASSGLNGRLQRLAQRVTAVVGNLDTIIADNSVGAVTENAPATDTASSGLNGRLQRVAQRLTTLSGQFASILADDSVGAVNETPPSSDTASAGLNGRLQRLAQQNTTAQASLDSIEASTTAEHDDTANAKNTLLVDPSGAALDMEGDVPVVGDVAHGEPSVTPIPVLIGADAVAHGANPTAVAAGERTRAISNLHSVPFVIGGHPNIISRSHLIADADGAQANAELVAVTGGAKIVLTRLTITTSGANSGALAILAVGFGTATIPTPSLVGVNGLVFDGRAVRAGFEHTIGDGGGMVAIGAGNEDLRLTCSDPVGGHVTVSYSYYTIES